MGERSFLSPVGKGMRVRGNSLKYIKISLILILFYSTFTFAGEIPKALPIPITIEEIIELSQADVSNEVIISQIKATQSVFYFTNEQIIQLKQTGVNDNVINFMIETGINIPHAILVEPPIRIRYYYYSDPWYDYWWSDPCYDHWWWRHRRWRRHHGVGIIYEEIR